MGETVSFSRVPSYSQMGLTVLCMCVCVCRAAVKAVLVLLPILGLTWLCGVLVPFSIVMAYIFVILNSLQVSVCACTSLCLSFSVGMACVCLCVYGMCVCV